MCEKNFYYYEILNNLGEFYYLKISVKPKSPEHLKQWLKLQGECVENVRELTEEEYEELTEDADE